MITQNQRKSKSNYVADGFACNQSTCLNSWFSKNVRGSFNILHWRHNGCEGVPNHWRIGCLLNRLFRCRPKKTSTFYITGLFEENSPMTTEFPAKRASNTEKGFHLMTSSWNGAALEHLSWQLLKHCLSILPIRVFYGLQKYLLGLLHHIPLWQILPQLNYYNTSQIWTWVKSVWWSFGKKWKIMCGRNLA